MVDGEAKIRLVRAVAVDALAIHRRTHRKTHPRIVRVTPIPLQLLENSHLMVKTLHLEVARLK